jgi:predicted dehydrogenase
MNSLPASAASPSTAATTPLSRRTFLAGASAATAFTILPSGLRGGAGRVSPNGKTTLAAIGTGGQGLQNVQAFLEFPELQVVSVCDVNREGPGYISWNWDKGNATNVAGREPARRLVEAHYAKDRTSGAYRGCTAYADYRELLAKEDVDAVMIATPDHTHAVIAMDAIKRGKHVYCEKPLAYTAYEVRQLTAAAKKAGVATQLGNQGQATVEARTTCEMIWSGAIGAVREVHVAIGPRFWPPALFAGRPTETMSVPAGLDWDLWLGPAPARPYHSAYCPWNWRNWWDFGTGLFGDLGCHKLSTVFKALKLGHPTSIEASSTKHSGEVYPDGVLAHFEFPARGDQPPVTIHWYDGGLKPARPRDLEPGRGIGDTLYVGDRGTLMGYRLIPESKMKDFARPTQKLPPSPGHYKEFVDACRGGPRAGSDFVEHAGLLSETCVLGNVALRSGKKLTWDGPNFKFTNDTAANRLLHREYRAGWSLGA